MGFLSALAQELVSTQNVYDLSSSSDFYFFGLRETKLTIDFVGLVQADGLSEAQIVQLRERFFETVQRVSYQFGIKPYARNPNGLLCFIYQQSPKPQLSSFIAKQTQVSHFQKPAVTISWMIDVRSQQVYTHDQLVSAFPPVFILESTVFPGKSYIEQVLASDYSVSKAVDVKPAAEKPSIVDTIETRASVEQLESLVDKLTQAISDLSKSPTTVMSQSTTNYTFNGPTSGVIGNTLNDQATIQGNTFTQTNAEAQDLAEAAAEIQALLEQLSQTYPMETLTQKAQLAEVALLKIEEQPGLKKRLLSALDAGAIGAISEALNHPVAAFVIEAVKDWNQSKAQ